MLCFCSLILLNSALSENPKTGRGTRQPHKIHCTAQQRTAAHSSTAHHPRCISLSFLLPRYTSQPCTKHAMHTIAASQPLHGWCCSRHARAIDSSPPKVCGPGTCTQSSKQQAQGWYLDAEQTVHECLQLKARAQGGRLPAAVPAPPSTPAPSEACQAGCPHLFISLLVPPPVLPKKRGGGAQAGEPRDWVGGALCAGDSWVHECFGRVVHLRGRRLGWKGLEKSCGAVCSSGCHPRRWR